MKYQKSTLTIPASIVVECRRVLVTVVKYVNIGWEWLKKGFCFIGNKIDFVWGKIYQ